MKKEIVHGKAYQPIEGLKCGGCVFYNDKKIDCATVRCMGHERTDKKTVFFISTEERNLEAELRED